MRELIKQREDMAVIHILAYDEQHKRRLCLETPISKVLIEDPLVAQAHFVDMILTDIAQMMDEGAFFHADL